MNILGTLLINSIHNKGFNINAVNETGWQLKEIEAVKNFKYNWFKNNVSVKDNLNFNSKSDFVILPEIFAHLAEDLLIKNRIKYAIFVQNGYAITFTSNEKKLIKAYPIMKSITVPVDVFVLIELYKSYTVRQIYIGKFKYGGC